MLADVITLTKEQLRKSGIETLKSYATINPNDIDPKDFLDLTTYKFNSQFQERGSFATEISNELIKNETMFFNCDLEFAYKHGNEITRSFIDSLPDDWKTCDTVFDSRVHMLMPNWLSCIGGYHQDDVPRPNGGQPDYDNMLYKSEHIMGSVNADICPTQFAIGESTFHKVSTGENVYKVWHNDVMKKLEAGELLAINAKDRTLIQFDWQTWHTGTLAKSNGWRWFGRLSRNTDRTKTITNEIRRQTQVYMQNLTEGW